MSAVTQARQMPGWESAFLLRYATSEMSLPESFLYALRTNFPLELSYGKYCKEICTLPGKEAGSSTPLASLRSGRNDRLVFC